MFDRFGRRIDEILFPPEYWTLLKHGYQTGIVWHADDSVWQGATWMTEVKGGSGVRQAHS